MPTQDTNNISAWRRARNYLWTPGAPLIQNIGRVARAAVIGPAGVAAGAARATVVGEAREGLGNWMRNRQNNRPAPQPEPRPEAQTFPATDSQAPTSRPLPAMPAVGAQPAQPAMPLPSPFATPEEIAAFNEASSRMAGAPVGGQQQMPPPPGMTDAQFRSAWNLGSGGTGGVGAAVGGSYGAPPGTKPWYSSSGMVTGTRLRRT